MEFDPAKAYLKVPDLFKPFLVTDRGVPLAQVKAAPDLELLVFERGGQRRGLLKPDMEYHHTAQGELAGQHYLITY
jgi:hypothetical protein